MSKKWRSIFLSFVFAFTVITAINPLASASTSSSTYIQRYEENYPAYIQHELPVVKTFKAQDNGSLANNIVARTVWYMENGYMIYGHSNYATTGYIDCSNFVSLVYKDFGYDITSAARKYNTVGTYVKGVFSQRQKDSSKYTLVGIDKLKPGDILTFWKTYSYGKRYIGHVALYMGKINGKPTIIQTVAGRPTAIGITNDFSWWYGEHFAGARRVLGDSAQLAQSQQKTPKPIIPQVYQLPPQKPIVMP